jgi:hypothetical protein
MVFNMSLLLLLRFTIIIKKVEHILYQFTIIIKSYYN